jgi:DNA-directed RNA polymerase subunit RPC12/RpoP
MADALQTTRQKAGGGMIHFKCRQCRGNMEAPESLAGQTKKCPNCGRLNRVPRLDALMDLARRAAGVIDFKCEFCGEGMEAPHSLAGQAQECTTCGLLNRVPRLEVPRDLSQRAAPAVGSSVGRPPMTRYVRPGDSIEFRCSECGTDILAEEPLAGLTKKCMECGELNHVPGQRGPNPPMGWYAWWGGAKDDHPLSRQAAEEWVALNPAATHECLACGRDVPLANPPIPTMACPFCGFIPDEGSCRAYLKIIDGSRQRQIARQPRLRLEKRAAERRAALKNGPKRQGECSRCGKAHRSLRETEDKHWVCLKCYWELYPALATESTISHLRSVGFTVPDDLTEKEGKRLGLLYLGRKLGLSLPDDTPLAELLRMDAEDSFIQRLQPVFAAEHERHVTEKIERRSEYLPRVHHFYTKVAGVTYTNDDGSDRQQILSTCSPLEALRLEHEDNNPHDPHAIRVCTEDGRQIGHLLRDVASDVWWRMQHHFTYAAISANVTGGTKDQPTLGMNILLLVGRPGVPDEEIQAHLDSIMPSVAADAHDDRSDRSDDDDGDAPDDDADLADAR